MTWCSRRSGGCGSHTGREAEPHALLGDRHQLDVVETAGREPLEHPCNEVFGRARAARQSDDGRALEPRGVDLGLVIDEVAGLAALSRHLGETVRVRGVL